MDGGVLFKRKANDARLDEMNDEVTQHRADGLEEDDKENKGDDARSEIHGRAVDAQTL